FAGGARSPVRVISGCSPFAPVRPSDALSSIAAVAVRTPAGTRWSERAPTAAGSGSVEEIGRRQIDDLVTAPGKNGPKHEESEAGSSDGALRRATPRFRSSAANHAWKRAGPAGAAIVSAITMTGKVRAP